MAEACSGRLQPSMCFSHTVLLLEHARTRQLNFIAWYLNWGRGGVLRDAALVAFVSPDLDDWRFSYVREDRTLKSGVKMSPPFIIAKYWPRTGNGWG